MGLTTAMYTGLTGLRVNQTRVETIGNNIANVNTNAYRSFRTLFATQFPQTFSLGTAPSDQSGGTNPMQIGHGAVVATTQRTTQPGGIETTGMNTDLAVEGQGYFVVQSSAGRQFYTRDGAFTLNARNQLVTGNGLFVRGYGVDAGLNVVPGQLTNLTIPLGIEDVAKATSRVQMDGDLSAATTVASAAATTQSQYLVNGGGGDAAADTPLTDLRAGDNPGAILFNTGDRITVSGVAKGDRTVAPRTFVVGTDGNSLADLARWLQDTLAIQPVDGVPQAPPPGVTVESGRLVITSNLGEPHAIRIDASNVISNSTDAPVPFQFLQTQSAAGRGVYTTFTVYDSLGNAVPVAATFTLESKGAGGAVWRYYLESADPTSPQRALGSGTVAFDPNGQFLSSTGNQVSLDRAAAGANSPLTVTLDFGSVNGLSTATSNLIMQTQDGYPAGTLVDFGVGADGVITGVFSNGTTRPLGQVVLATFANDAGLVAEADNLFSAGPNSGEPAIKSPGQLGAGTVRGGALENSNVDLAREFIGLITSSTGFQAASRVISTANDMLDQLLLALR